LDVAKNRVSQKTNCTQYGENQCDFIYTFESIEKIYLVVILHSFIGNCVARKELKGKLTSI